MKKGLVIIGLIIAGLIGVGVLVFSATLELIEGVFTLIGWGVLILIGWLVYQFKFKS
jgi:hypothetical protein